MRDAKTTRIAEVNLSQPITVALQLCLVDLLKSWGITPDAVTAHSSGEIAAGYVFGTLTFAEALGAAFYRGELALRNEPLKKLSGAMAAAGLGQEDAAKYLVDTPGGRVVVACVNSPGSVTLSGDMEALDVVEKRIQADGIFARKLKVPLAYHSHHMQCLAQDYLNSLQTILSAKSGEKQQSESTLRYASPVTGEIVTSPKSLAPDHWVRNLTSPVLFSQSFDKMCFAEDGTPQVDMIIEVGPHGTLSGPIRQILKAKGKEFPYGSCLTRNVDAVETMQTLASDLISRGYPVSLPAINSPLGEKHAFVRDLPSYAWNHTQRYWVESRINRQMAHKKFPPHELLGTILPGNNGLTPIWRNFLRLADLPWLMDHQVEGGPVLPGAGYITLAIEATRLLESQEKPVTSYNLRDIEISNALAIPEGSAGIEIQLSMRPTDENEYEFTLSSISTGDNWIVNCKGYVSAEHDAKDGEQAVNANAFFIPGLKPRHIEPDDLFAGMREMGFYHGPTFQNLTDVKFSRKKAIAGISIPEVASEGESYVIHPTTLDSIIVAAYTNIPKKIQQTSLVVPRSIRSMSVRAGLNNQSGEKLLALAECLSSEERGFTSSIAILNGGEGTSTPVVDMKDFFAIAVPRPTDEQVQKKPLTSSIQWELDIFSSQIPSSFKDSIRLTPDEEAKAFEKKILRASYYLIHDAVKELEKTPGQGEGSWEPHCQKLYTWLKQTAVLGETGSLAPGSKVWARAKKGLKQMLYDELAATDNAAAQLTVKVGRQLAKIIRGEVAPLDLVKEDDLLSKYYSDRPGVKDRSYQQLSKIIELFAISKPGAKVLEIGAGAGSAAKVVLDAFGAKAERGSLLGRYTYTDVSDSFFEAAGQKVSQWSDIVEFKTLNIEDDPLAQSFESFSYDLIVASEALHATKSLNRTLANVRKLLKPGGKLVLIETTQDPLDTELVFGTLPEWWNGEEDFRKSSPHVPVKTWDSVLRETGFAGVDFDISDSEDAEFQSTSLIIASVETKTSYPSSVSIVHSGTPPPQQWLQELSSAIQTLTGGTPIVENLFDIKTSEDSLYIFTPEITAPFVHGLDETSFNKLRDLLVGCQNLLWLSSGGAIDSVEPVFGETQGLLRTLRQEDASKRCVQLDFTPVSENPWTSDKIGRIVDIIKQTFDSTIVSPDRESEFAVKDSLIYVPRVYPDLEVKVRFDLSDVHIIFVCIHTY